MGSTWEIPEPAGLDAALAETAEAEPEQAEPETEQAEPETEQAEQDEEPETEEPSAEGEEEGEEKEEDPKLGEFTDETQIPLEDGTEVSIGELKQAWGILETATERIKEAEAAIEDKNKVLSQLRDAPADTLLSVFTAVAGGDSGKGYAHLVDLAEKIIVYDEQQKQLPEGDRLAKQKEREVEELRKRLEQYELSEKQKQRAEAELNAARTIQEEIAEAIKSNGLPNTAESVQRVAEAMYMAQERGLKLTAGVAASRIKKAFAKQRAQLLETLDDEELPDTVKEKLRKKAIAEAKKKKRSSGAPSGSPARISENVETGYYRTGALFG